MVTLFHWHCTTGDTRVPGRYQRGVGRGVTSSRLKKTSWRLEEDGGAVRRLLQTMPPPPPPPPNIYQIAVSFNMSYGQLSITQVSKDFQVQTTSSVATALTLTISKVSLGVPGWV
jgi:hypothetical protein